MSASTQPTSLFDRWSATYDSAALQASTYRPIHDAMLSRLADHTAPNTILDLGCGTGQLTRRLTAEFPGANIIALDYSPGMLAAAHERVTATIESKRRTGLLRGDAQRLPLSDASIDVVVCSESFHWYSDQRQALLGLAGILRPRGRLLIASIATVTSFGHDVVRNVSGLTGQPIRALSPRQMRTLLAEGGFEVIHQKRIPRLGLIPWPVLTDSIRR